MIKNKKAAENTAIFPAAKRCSNNQRTFTLSDKIRILYRYFRLSEVEKGSVLQWVNSAYECRMSKLIKTPM